MTGKSKTVEENLEALRVAYAAKLSDKLTSLKATADSIVPENSSDSLTEALTTLRFQAHNLAGSAGAFGFSEIGDAARKLDLFCQTLPQDSSPRSQSDCQHIAQLVESLLQIHRQSLNTEPADMLAGPGKESSGDTGLGEDRKILLVGDDLGQSALFESGLSAFAYDVRTVDAPQKVLGALDAFQPAATILDLEFNGRATAGAKTIETVRNAIGADCPLVVLAARGDFDARLAAIRAGCDQFLTKPVKVDEIIPILEKFETPNEDNPERVLVIDDDPDILEFVTATLQSADMIVETLSDPELILKRLEDSHWEIVIIDLHMPKCSGRELAALIRQKPEYMAIPIVFLSAEADKSIQLDAMGAGADDFLSKQIVPKHLVAAVRSRVERFRVLRNLMNRDSLTHLYNHATTWQLLEGEMSKAKRSSAPLSFAMIDIDHFKSVNDTLGHAVGDIVLKALSKLLKHRFRASDIIGRLGGEEFGVVLPSTTADQACSVIEEIRISFSNVSQAAAGSAKPITFSCGIAAFPEHKVATNLAEAADHALYEAKETGRNKIVIAA